VSGSSLPRRGARRSAAGPGLGPEVGAEPSRTTGSSEGAPPSGTDDTRRGTRDQTPSTAVTAPAAGRSLRSGLRSPAAARRAIVLREVLGPPVALRRGGSDIPGLGG
jgi:hypothetical protein